MYTVADARHRRGAGITVALPDSPGRSRATWRRTSSVTSGPSFSFLVWTCRGYGTLTAHTDPMYGDGHQGALHYSASFLKANADIYLWVALELHTYQCVLIC